MPTLSSPTALSERVGQFASKFALSQVSKEGVLRAKLSILDSIGVALAATRHEFAHKTLTGLSSMGDRGTAPVIGMPTSLTVRDSMLMNGALIHGVDFDDSHQWGAFHPTSSALTCALGTGHHVGATGRDVLAAYIVGIEVMVRVGGAASGFFQPLGFHPTGYCGAFGCAVGAGWLMGASATQHANAQGIVWSAASGSMEFLAEGAWTKRLHPGQAAVAGFQAAALALQGFIGPRLPYEGRFGLYRSLFPQRYQECKLEAVAAGLGEVWEVEHMAVKPYPACHYTHSCADGIFALMKAGLKASDVERVIVKVPREEMPIVCEPLESKRRPQTGYEAKFSIPYSVAVSLVTGKHGLAQFEDESLLHRPDIVDLCDKVFCEIDDNANFPRNFSSDITVELKNGKRLHQREQFNRGCVDLPLTPEDVIEKFMENANLVMSERRSANLRDAILNLDTREDLGEFARLLAGGMVAR